MSRLAVIVPTRGRPAKAARLAAAFDETAIDASLVFAVDDNDPCLPGYEQHLAEFTYVVFKGHPTMIEKLNEVALRLAPGHDYLGFLGDDCLPRTQGWDQRIVAELDARPPGIVYVNDLFQQGNLPCHVFLPSALVQRLGWMALPALRHLYCDNVWLDLGRALGSCTYLPDVVIEHLHPHAGKAEGDEQYAAIYADEAALADHQAWTTWREQQLATDVAKIQEAA